MASVRELAFAVRHIERSRETHHAWLDYWARHPKGCACGEDHPAQESTAGGPEHHEQFIAGYDKVLRILREVEADVV